MFTPACLAGGKKSTLVIAFAESLLALTRVDSTEPAAFPRHGCVDVIETIVIDLTQVLFTTFQVGRRCPNSAPSVRIGKQSITAVLSAECTAEQFGIRQTLSRGGVLRHWRNLGVRVDWDRLDQVEAIRFGGAPFFRRDRVEHPVVDHAVGDVITFVIAWSHHRLSSVGGRLPTTSCPTGQYF